MYLLKRYKDGEYRPLHAIQAHKGWIDSVALSNNASILVTVCRDESELILWDVKQGASVLIDEIYVHLHRHTAAIYGVHRTNSRHLLQLQPVQP